MKRYIAFFILIMLVVFTPGCVRSPFEKVPVVRVELSLGDGSNGSVVTVEEFDVTPDTVSRIRRPRDRTYDAEFPGVTVRPTIWRNVTVNGEMHKKVLFGNSASVPYTGAGKYSLVAGFKDGVYPQKGERVHIMVMVVDASGRQTTFSRDIQWEIGS